MRSEIKQENYHDSTPKCPKTSKFIIHGTLLLTHNGTKSYSFTRALNSTTQQGFLVLFHINFNLFPTCDLSKILIFHALCNAPKGAPIYRYIPCALFSLKNTNPAVCTLAKLATISNGFVRSVSNYFISDIFLIIISRPVLFYLFLSVRA